MDKWEEIGALTSGKDAAIYKVQSFKVKLGNRRYRFLVVHSSNLDQRKAKSLEAAKQEQLRLEKVCEEIQKPAICLRSRCPICLESIAKETQRNILFANRTNRFGRGANSETGSSTASKAPEVKTVYRIEIQVTTRNEEAWQLAKDRASTFVLITNLKNEQTHSNTDTLCHYKDQNSVEMRFRFLKDPKMLDGGVLAETGTC